MDILVLEKALNTVKSLLTLAVVLNGIILLVGLINCLRGGRFNDNINS